jgi:iron complex outermembrane receptor protein
MAGLPGRHGIVWICTLALAGIAAGRAAEATDSAAEAEQVTVVGQSAEPGSRPSVEESEREKAEVPGGFSVKTTDEMKEGRSSGFDDLLRRVPGVFTQSENGSEVSKISIRGSGITSEDEPLGVMFLLDGLSYNQADGESILEDLDVSSLSHAEVFRGASGLKYGALTLGGAINLVPFTGRDAAALQVRVEGGSYGYLRTNVSGGEAQAATDEFASASARIRDGFRDHSAENSEILFADIGCKLNEETTNRFYLTLDRTDRDLPGGLTKHELENDPRQANPLAVAQDWNKSWSYLRVADKFSICTKDWDFDAGAFWFYRELENRGFFAPDFRSGIEMFYSNNFGALLDFVWRGEVFSLPNVLSLGVSPQGEIEPSQNYENLRGHAGRTTARGTGSSVNAPLFIEDQLHVTQEFSFIAGAQLVFAQRQYDDEFHSALQGDQSHRQDWLGFNPKFGAIYEFNPETQIFANVSRSWQPPSLDNLAEFSEGNNSSLIYTPLDPQHAWTAELGTRGSVGPVRWDLSLYRSWLADELLELSNAQGSNIKTVNARATIHQGIEASAEIELLKQLFMRQSATQPGDQITFQQTYTINDFHFDNDPVYGDNRLGGIPIHSYEAELEYQAPVGFFAAVTLRSNLSRYPVDHANTLFADPYALLGARIGFRRASGFSVFVEARNLTDENYAASIDVIADARAEGQPEIFHPGDGRAVYGGVSWSWY